MDRVAKFVSKLVDIYTSSPSEDQAQTSQKGFGDPTVNLWLDFCEMRPRERVYALERFLNYIAAKQTKNTTDVNIGEQMTRREALSKLAGQHPDTIA